MNPTGETLVVSQSESVAAHGIRLVVDYGTASTRAVVCWPDGRRLALATGEGSLHWPSGVLVAADGTLMAGPEAVAAAGADPAGPGSLCRDLKSVLTREQVTVGERSFEPAAGLAAVLTRLAAQARGVSGLPVVQLSITTPASWGPRHRSVLRLAAEKARLPDPQPIAVPVAAAWLLSASGLADLPAGSSMLICDFGHSGFEASVLAHVAGQFVILSTARRASAGGHAIDAVLIEHCLTVLSTVDFGLAGRLRTPESPADRRTRSMLEGHVEAARRQLSAGESASVTMPRPYPPLSITTDQLTELIMPIGSVCAQTTIEVMDAAGIDPAALAGVYSIGGSMTSTALAAVGEHCPAPVRLPQPDLVAAFGAAHTPAPGQPAPRVARGRRAWRALPALGALGAAVCSVFLFALAIYSSPVIVAYREYNPALPGVNWGEYAVACCCVLLAATATVEALPAVRLPAPKRPGAVRVPRLAYAAVTGLVVCVVYGAIGTASVHLPSSTDLYLRWALLPALPIAALSALTGLLHQRYPTEAARAELTGRRRWFPLEAAAATGVGMVMIQIPLWGSQHDWFWYILLRNFGADGADTWEETLSRVGFIAVGAGIALAVTTTSRIRILTVPVAAAITAIIPVGPPDLLGLAWVSAASTWWVMRTLRLVVATAHRWRPRLPAPPPASSPPPDPHTIPAPVPPTSH